MMEIGGIGMIVNGSNLGDVGVLRLPSLNIFDYEIEKSFPVFEEFPGGISRKDMPQISYKASQEQTFFFWERFRSKIENNGGRISVETNVDLREIHSFQKEISGHIVHNVLLEKFTAKLFQDDHLRIENELENTILPDIVQESSGVSATIPSEDYPELNVHFLTSESKNLMGHEPFQDDIQDFEPENGAGDNMIKRKSLAESSSFDPNKLFSERIILVKSPQRILTVNSLGEWSYLPKNSLFILDGHHTHYLASDICTLKFNGDEEKAKLKLEEGRLKTLLRRGHMHFSYNKEDNVEKALRRERDLLAIENADMRPVTEFEGSFCGPHFRIKQDFKIIEGLNILEVRRLALESGALSGHEMNFRHHP